MDGDFTPLRREPAYLKVCRAIEERIVTGALGDGASLPTESELCEQFAVTRSTVREGIRMLEQTGLVERGPAKRLFVKKPHTEDVAAAASRGLSLGGATFHEAWESLNAVYPQAGRIAAIRLDQKGVQKLRAHHEKLSQVAANAHAEIVRETVLFFEEIAHGQGNRVMTAMLQSLNLMIEKGLARVIASNPQAQARILKAQKEILNAIGDHDPDRAALWLRRHIDDLQRGYEIAGFDPNAPVL